MVYVSGEEMTRYTMQLVLDQWIAPFVDTTAWESYDFSVRARSDSDDNVVKEAILAGARIKSIFKEPTITPSKEQSEATGTKPLGSPNGAIRKGWNGITISRDTTHVPGLKLGYARPVLFDRQAVGGEYGAQAAMIEGKGKLELVYTPEGGKPQVVIERAATADSEVVLYHNPLETMEKLAHHFFSRALEAKVTPYVVTKKTVFKFQEPFWERLKKVFDRDYRDKFAAAGLLENTGGKLAHLISDAATMKLVTWKEGGFAMVAHNYDGDVLTDLISQVHCSPAFLTSVLVGVAPDGTKIKAFEASHGTVSDMDAARLKGERTSMNPLGLVIALADAMDWSAELVKRNDIQGFTKHMKESMFRCLADSRATSDIAGKGKGSSTEEFIAAVAKEMAR